MIKVGWDIAPAIISYLTGDVPTTQERLFADDPILYPVLVEAPQAIRPGDTFAVVIRGAEYTDFSTSATLTFTVEADDLSFVRDIAPPITQTTALGNRWLLKPIEIDLATVDLDHPPEQFSLTISETLDSAPGSISSDSSSVEIEVDKTPIPPSKITRGIISLLGFLIGTFGAVIISKLI
jgi:hypothetical protein